MAQNELVDGERKSSLKMAQNELVDGERKPSIVSKMHQLSFVPGISYLRKLSFMKETDEALKPSEEAIRETRELLYSERDFQETVCGIGLFRPKWLQVSTVGYKKALKDQRLVISPVFDSEAVGFSAVTLACSFTLKLSLRLDCGVTPSLQSLS